MIISVDDEGVIEMIHNDDVEVDNLGKLKEIRRASKVEWEDASEGNDGDGWYADLSPIKGPKLGPFKKRMEALAAEVKWIEENYFKD